MIKKVGFFLHRFGSFGEFFELAALPGKKEKLCSQENVEGVPKWGFVLGKINGSVRNEVSNGRWNARKSNFSHKLTFCVNII